MDHLAFVQAKLQFIRDFYKKAAKPFKTTKRQIEKRTGPFRHYPPGFDPEDAEPPYIEEWVEADADLNILGQSCLCLIQISFKDFLDVLAKGRGNAKPNTKGNWFKKYKNFFQEHYGIDWDGAHVDLALLEDICLTRNSIQHSQHHRRFYSLDRTQTADHRARFPDSIFADGIDKQLFPSARTDEPYRIKVTEESLYAALETIEKFCAYLVQSSHP